MKADGVMVTWIAPEEEERQKERKGFVPTCQYGDGLMVHRSEIGCIASQNGRPGMTVSGIWVVPVRVRERIFTVLPE